MEEQHKAKSYRNGTSNNYIVYVPSDSMKLITFNEAVIMMTDDGFKIRESTILDNKCFKVRHYPSQIQIGIMSKHMDLTGDFEMEIISDWIYFIKDI